MKKVHAASTIRPWVKDKTNSKQAYGIMLYDFMLLNYHFWVILSLGSQPPTEDCETDKIKTEIRKVSLQVKMVIYVNWSWLMCEFMLIEADLDVEYRSVCLDIKQVVAGILMDACALQVSLQFLSSYHLIHDTKFYFLLMSIQLMGHCFVNHLW